MAPQWDTAAVIKVAGGKMGRWDLSNLFNLESLQLDRMDSKPPDTRSPAYRDLLWVYK